MSDDKDIDTYNKALNSNDKAICDELRSLIESTLKKAEGKVWHGHPVWFIDGNPVAGYSIKKAGVELLFWSGQSFTEPGLKPVGKYKAAGAIFKTTDNLSAKLVKAWLKQSIVIQWDYANLPKKRSLEKLTQF